jgi:hypothetical protein
MVYKCEQNCFMSRLVSASVDPHNEIISIIPIIFCCLYFVFHYLCLSSSIVFCYFESTYGPNACWHQAVHETILCPVVSASITQSIHLLVD